MSLVSHVSPAFRLPASPPPRARSKFSWCAGRVAGRQPLDGFSQVRGREVRVALHHARRAPTAEFLHRTEIDSGHY